MRPFAVLALTIAATSMMLAQPSKQIIANPNPSLPFSAAIKADGLVYVSGTLGSAASGNITTQTRQVLDTISATLKSAGSTLANAASMIVYLRNQSDVAAMNEVYRTYWSNDPPARTTVIVPLLNDGLIEIAAVAVPDGGERVVVHPDGWLRSNPYSYGVKSGNTLFLAGLISRNGKDNSPIGGDVAAQTKTVMDSGSAVLKAAGMKLSDVVSSRVYLTARASI
jgi:2-iminobutanoate/2-iminopropanoate deaminase